MGARHARPDERGSFSGVVAGCCLYVARPGRLLLLVRNNRHDLAQLEGRPVTGWALLARSGLKF